MKIKICFLVTALAVLLYDALLSAEAQQPRKIPRIGYLRCYSASICLGPHRGIPPGSARAWLRGGEKHCH